MLMEDYFEELPEVASDALNWRHWTAPEVMAVPYEPGLEVDEIHQYDEPIGGAYSSDRSMKQEYPDYGMGNKRMGDNLANGKKSPGMYGKKYAGMSGKKSSGMYGKTYDTM